MLWEPPRALQASHGGVGGSGIVERAGVPLVDNSKCLQYWHLILCVLFKHDQAVM